MNLFNKLADEFYRHHHYHSTQDFNNSSVRLKINLFLFYHLNFLNKTESANTYKPNVAVQQQSVPPQPAQPPPVLTTESVHINIKNIPSSQAAASKPLPATSPAVIDIEPKNNLNKSVTTSFSTASSAPTPNEQGLRTIELSSGRVREGNFNYII